MIRQSLKMLWRKRGQNAFISIEILLSFLILFAVFSLIGRQMERYRQPLGFQHEQVANTVLDMEGLRAELTSEEEVFDSITYLETLERLRREVQSINGIVATTYSTNVTPFNGSNWSTTNDPGDDTPPGDSLIYYNNCDLIFVDEFYNDVFQAKLAQGRWYTEADTKGNYIPLVVNQKFVEMYIKEGASVLGRKLEVWDDLYTIVGVVEAFKYRGEFEDERPLMFPYIGNYSNAQFMLVAFDEQLNPSWEYDLQQVVENNLRGISFFTYQLENARWEQSRPSWTPIIGLLALCAFLVINVAMGLFGVLQYNIKKRRGEIGLRKVIGAHPGKIRQQFLIEMMVIASFGLIVGVLLAVQVPLLGLFDFDNRVFYQAIVLSLAFIYLLVIVCSLVPSSQAAKLQPAIALHENG